MSPLLNPQRTIAELKQLRALTGDADGAQRVAFTETWSVARAWFRRLLPDALAACGIDFERVKESPRELANAAAYIELYIEQGPVLLDLDLPLGAVLGTFGVERHAVTFHGQAAHSGSTPINRRRDAFLAAAKMSPGIYQIAARSGQGVCTIGSCTTKPGIVTSVVEECRITLDQRHPDARALAVMMFTQSLHGISHNKIEDTLEEHLVAAVVAFDKLAQKAIGWIGSRS